MKHCNIPIFIPHLGCPHQCVFCNQKKITGKQQAVTLLEARQTIEEHLSCLSCEPKEIEIAFFGGSFTAIPVREQQAYLALAKEYVTRGQVGGIRLSTRPDAVETDTLHRLSHFGVTTVELGVQSFCDQVLQQAERLYDEACIWEACRRVKQAGFSLGVQLMCGLPGDTLQRSVQSAQKAVRAGADFARIYPALVLDQTPLADQYRQGIYQPLSLSEAVEWTALMTEALLPVPVIRTGLCMDGLEEQDVIAGPVHPAFGELVASKRYDEKVRDWLKGKETKGRKLTILAPLSEHSKLIGQHGSNRKGWKQSYELCEIQILAGDKLEFLLKMN